MKNHALQNSRTRYSLWTCRPAASQGAYRVRWGYVGCEASAPRVLTPGSSALEPGTNKSPAGHADKE